MVNAADRNDLIENKLPNEVNLALMKSPTLVAVQCACFSNGSLSNQEKTALHNFNKALQLKTMKFTKNEKADEEYKQAYKLKTKFFHVVRAAWTVGIFNNEDPIRDFDTTGIHTYKRWEELVISIAQKISAIVFNNKEILWQVQLPDAQRKTTNLYIC
jgi:hypothetical protein